MFVLPPFLLLRANETRLSYLLTALWIFLSLRDRAGKCCFVLSKWAGPNVRTWLKVHEAKSHFRYENVVSVAHSERIYFLFLAVMFSKLDGENNLEFQMVRILSKPRY